MNIDISKEQKEALTKKVALCVEYIKNDVQPYLTSKDNIVINIDEFLDFCLTNKDYYIKQTRILDCNFFEVPLNKIFYLDKRPKAVKKYVCLTAPEIALAFLKQWDKIKHDLNDKVIQNTSDTNKLNDFIDNFKI